MQSKPYNKRRLFKFKNWSYLLDDDAKTAWIAKGHIGRCKRYKIPNSVDIDGKRYTITSIEMGAFNNPRTLRHLSIPDSIEYVDEDEFLFMSKLRSIYIGKGLKHLTDWHFRREKSNVPLLINPKNLYLKTQNNLILTGDGKTVLCTMKRCRSYIIPEGVERIYACAMWWNKILEEVILPSTLKVVGDNGLSNNPNIRRLVFPEGFETFDVQGLMDCTGLEYLDLPSTLKKLTDSLYGCSNLKTIIIRTNHVFDASVDFDDVPRDCKIIVPSNLLDDYKKHSFWQNYNIECTQSVSV